MIYYYFYINLCFRFGVSDGLSVETKNGGYTMVAAVQLLMLMFFIWGFCEIIL